MVANLYDALLYCLRLYNIAYLSHQDAIYDLSNTVIHEANAYEGNETVTTPFRELILQIKQAVAPNQESELFDVSKRSLRSYFNKLSVLVEKNFKSSIVPYDDSFTKFCGQLPESESSKEVPVDNLSKYFGMHDAPEPVEDIIDSSSSTNNTTDGSNSKAIKMDYLETRPGFRLPSIAFGLAGGTALTVQMVVKALKVGYRLFDMAQEYGEYALLCIVIVILFPDHIPLHIYL